MAYLLKDISNNILLLAEDSSANLGKNIIASSVVNGFNVQGTYISNNVSAIKIPADSSNNRPSGQIGYIRYNTDSNYIEYWNGLTNSWVPISEPTPSVTGINPSYVPADSSFNYTISGYNFTSYSSVSFIGNVDSITYNTYGGTSFINSATLQARNTIAMSDASNNTGFFVKVTNTNSNITGISSTAILSYNQGPVWVTAANTNLGTGISGITYTTGTKPFTDLSAVDVSPPNLPLSFAYTSTGSPTGAPGILLSTSGQLYGTSPTLTTVVSTTYNFTAIVTDASGSFGPQRQFFFTISLPIATITGSGTSIVGYTDSSGNNFTQVAPYANGYTVYIFTSGTSTFTTSPYFPPYVSYLVVGGGGAGGAGDSGGSAGGGGGAGGYLSGYKAITSNTPYTITVGSGGSGTTSVGGSGSASSVTGTGISLSAAGGGGGGNNFTAGFAGGSGGGGGLRNNVAGGAGNTPSTTPSQGNAGGYTMYGNTSSTGRGGGGGGALARGAGGYGNSELSNNPSAVINGPGGTGGSGILNNIRGTGNIAYSGGGGGGGYDRQVGSGGSGGGGSGSGLGNSSTGFNTLGGAGTPNTGGGGGGTSSGTGAGSLVGGAGGSGIVILRHLSNIIVSNIQSSFTINNATYAGTPLSGIFRTSPGYQTGTNTTPGTATVTYVDANGANPVAWSSGPYAGGYTIVTFLTTTPSSPYTFGPSNPGGTYLAVPNQVQYYGNTTDFSFNVTNQFPSQIEYLIIGGGGTGAKGTGSVTYGGGGGAGQVLSGTFSILPNTNYTLRVGSGGVMDPNGASSTPVAGGNTVYYNLSIGGVNTTAFGLTAIGGGGGNGGTNTVTTWNPAGTSGVGGISGNGFLGGLNAANGVNGTNPAGGGGGASDYGKPPNTNWPNSGGYGIASAISGTYTGYAAGGGGGGDAGVTVASSFQGGTTPAGVIIGGNGGGSGAASLVPTAGTANTGSGGGGMRADDIGAGGGGGTGIIILKFPSYVC